MPEIAVQIGEGLFCVLARHAAGRANAIVVAHEKTFDGEAALLALKARYGREPQMGIEHVFNFKWEGVLEDRWRGFLSILDGLITPLWRRAS